MHFYLNVAETLCLNHFYYLFNSAGIVFEFYQFTITQLSVDLAYHNIRRIYATIITNLGLNRNYIETEYNGFTLA